jgi:hypothetical protein
MSEKILTIISVLAVILASLGIGRLLTSFMPESLTPPERWGLRFLVGAGALGTMLFLIGLITFTPAVIGCVVVLSAALNLWRGKFVEPFSVWRKGGDWRGAVVVSLAVLTLAFLALASLAPLVGEPGNDTIRYHLLGPAQWLREGQIHPVLDESHTAFPAVVETLFAAVMALSRSDNPCLLSVAFAVALLAQVYGLTKRLGGDEFAACLSVGLFVMMPVVMVRVGTGYVDVAFTAFVLAMVRIAFDAAGWRSLLLAGLLGGFALGTKYTGLVALAVTAVCLLFARRHAGSLRQRSLWAAVLVATACVVGSPWYLKNLLLLGTPIYPPPPLLARLLPGKAFSPEASERFQQFILNWGKGSGRGLLDFLLLPIRFTYWTNIFHGPLVGIGLAPLALGPVGLASVRRQEAARTWAAWAFLSAVAWFLTNQDYRFLLHVVAVATAFAAVGGGILLRQASRWGRVSAWSLVVVSMCYGGFALLRLRGDDVRAAISPRFAKERAAQEVPLAAAYDFLNRADGVSKVLILNPGVMPYFIRHPYVKVVGSLGEQPLADVRTPQDAVAQVSSLGVSHVLDVKLAAAHVWDKSYEKGEFVLTSGAQRGGCLELLYRSDEAQIFRVNCRAAVVAAPNGVE